MNLSEHDLEAVADVAAFCSTDDARPSLHAVHFDAGWVVGTDSYRLDAREVDSDHEGAVDPFTGKPVEVKPLKVWPAVEGGPRGAHVSTAEMHRADLPKRPRPWAMWYCLGCRSWGDKTDNVPVNACRCDAPLFDLRLFIEAMAGADEPSVVWRWRTYDLLRPARYDEYGHFHLLMPIRRAGAL